MKAQKTQKTEHQEQSEFVRRFRARYPGYVIFAIPNGGSRGGERGSAAITGRLLKDEGVTPGVPDLFIPALRAFIEMKKKGGTLSAAQSKMLYKLASDGYDTCVARSADEALAFVHSLIEYDICKNT